MLVKGAQGGDELRVPPLVDVLNMVDDNKVQQSAGRVHTSCIFYTVYNSLSQFMHVVSMTKRLINATDIFEI